MALKEIYNKTNKKFYTFAAVICTIILLLNICGCFPGFCDWYREKVYCRIADGLGALSDALPFCLGEVLMEAGIVLVILAFIVCIILVIRKCCRKYRRKPAPPFCIHFLKAFAGMLLVLLLIYTLNWILPIRASRISFDAAEDRVYTIEELQNLREYMVEHLNEAAENVERDSSGNVVYCTGSELDEAVAEAMQALGEEYPLLEGFYPKNKVAGFSAVLDWMDIGGYTYPYTMELTTNRYVTGLYLPMLLAHEQSHHKGYYLESEANFIAYRALSASTDVRLQYAAYENMYYYVNSALVQSLKQTLDEDELKEYYAGLPGRSDLVKSDEQYANDLKDQDYKNSVSESAEKLAPAAEKIADRGWKLQADALGDACYDGVVEMLLKYYDTGDFGDGGTILRK